MEKKNIVIIIAGILIFIILIIGINKKKKANLNIEKTTKFDTSEYDYDNSTSEYVLYDENGNERFRTTSKDVANRVAQDKDYNQDFLPPGFEEDTKSSIPDDKVEELK